MCRESNHLVTLCLYRNRWKLGATLPVESFISPRKKKEKKEKKYRKRKWWRLKHGFVCVCGKCVKYMCVSEREGGKKTATVTYFWVISFQKGRESFCKIQWEFKNDSSSVNAESRTLSRDLLTHQSDQSSLSGAVVGFPSRSVWASFRPGPGMFGSGDKGRFSQSYCVLGFILHLIPARWWCASMFVLQK